MKNPKSQEVTVVDSQITYTQINDFIDVFHQATKEFSSNNLFANKTQRKIASEFIERWGFDRAMKFAKFAVSLHGITYAPQITNPLELRERLPKLKLFYEQEMNKGGGIFKGTDFSKKDN